MRKALVLLVFLGLAASARAEDNPACAKYDDALAYNACLARLGSKAYFGGPSTAAPASSPSANPKFASHRAEYSFGRDRRGRQHAVFAVGK